MIKTNSKPLRSWKAFEKQIRSKGYCLLKRLDDFPDSILVTGCQRSGTTMVSRMIRRSDGMTDFQFGHDDELDAALILSGYVDHEPKGRYCFQTTYVNDSYHEYFSSQNGHKMIWVLRNPHSVVYSMLHHWRRAALNRLFKACGAQLLEGGMEKRKVDLLGVWTITRLRRACLAYNGKVSQIFEIIKYFGPEQLMIIDYDDFISNSNSIASKIYEFIDLNYHKKYIEAINSNSLLKKRSLSKREGKYIWKTCMPIYIRAKKL